MRCIVKCLDLQQYKIEQSRCRGSNFKFRCVNGERVLKKFNKLVISRWNNNQSVLTDFTVSQSVQMPGSRMLHNTKLSKSNFQYLLIMPSWLSLQPWRLFTKLLYKNIYCDIPKGSNIEGMIWSNMGRVKTNGLVTVQLKINLEYVFRRFRVKRQLSRRCKTVRVRLAKIPL